MTNADIYNTIQESEVALSAKGIAHHAGVDADTRYLPEIESRCWDMVESEHLLAYDRREEGQGLFFAINYSQLAETVCPDA